MSFKITLPSALLLLIGCLTSARSRHSYCSIFTKRFCIIAQLGRHIESLHHRSENYMKVVRFLLYARWSFSHCR